MKPFGRNEKGLALISVLWVGVLLGLLAALALDRSRTDLRLARNLEDAAAAELAADGAVRAMIAAVAASPDDWSTSRQIAIGPVRAVVRVENEAGRLDLNAASPELIAALLLQLGVSEAEASALAGRIADFRDRDSDRRPGGAEDADYAVAGLPAGAKDASFASVDELGRILGLEPALERRLTGFVTVHTGLSEPDGGAAEILAARQHLRARTEREAPGAQRRRAVRKILKSTEGRSPLLVRITAEARTGRGATFVREAVVEIDERLTDGYAIRSWGRIW